MEFSLDQDQTILKNEVRRFLQNECTMDFVKEMMEDEKGHSPTLWKKMAELGWMGLMFEEKYGGVGGSFIDLSVLLEEMGRFLVPGPFFPTVVLSGLTIKHGGSEQQKQKFLPGIARGDTLVTFALTEAEGSYAIETVKSKAEQKPDGYHLTGEKMFVPDAHIANYIIVPAKTQKKGSEGKGVSLFIVDAKSEGIEIVPLKSLDLKKQFKVSFKNVKVPKENLIGEEGQAGELIQKVWPMLVIAKSCEMLGAMQRVFEMTIDYAQNRYQFGRPLTFNQVIQHYCSDMAIDLEASRFMTSQAVWRVNEGLPSRKEVAMAKAWCSDAFKKIATTAHQIHGGIGFTYDKDLHPYFRFAKVAEATFGDANFQKEVVATEMDA